MKTVADQWMPKDRKKPHVLVTMLVLSVVEVVVAVVVLLLASCTAHELPADRWQPTAVAFTATPGDEGEQTRAENAIGDASALTTAGGFGVFACHTGLHRYGDSDVTSDFMYNQHVSYDGINGVWSYQPVKYWPNGESDGSGETAAHYVSFFAYAPYSDASGSTAASYCISSFHRQHEVGNPWLTYRLHTDVAQQVDLLYGVPLLDKTKTGDRLPFRFKHALACVGDEVTVSMDSELKEAYRGKVGGATTAVAVRLTSVSISYTLTEKGRLVLWAADAEPNWQTISSENPTTVRNVSLTAGLPHTLYSYDGSAAGGSAWEDTGHGVFYLPIEHDGRAQTATITVGYDVVTTTGGVSSADSRTTTATLTLGDYTDGYQPGKHTNLHVVVKRD